MNDQLLARIDLFISFSENLIFKRLKNYNFENYNREL